MKASIKIVKSPNKECLFDAIVEIDSVEEFRTLEKGIEMCINEKTTCVKISLADKSTLFITQGMLSESIVVLGIEE